MPLNRRSLLRAALAAAALLALPASLARAQGADEPTVVLVTRHAERAGEMGGDPGLTDAGSRRAESLAAALQDAGVSAAIVTQYRRAKLTAAPAAARLGIAVVERPAGQGVTPDVYAAALAQELKSSWAGKSVLVVGHSNTVPAIVKALAGKDVGPIADDRYGDLFIVVIPKTGPARLLRTRVD